MKVPSELLYLAVVPLPDAEWRLIAQDAALPDHFEADLIPRDTTLARVTLEVRIIDGRPTCVRLGLRALAWTHDSRYPKGDDPASGPITGTTLRRIPLGRYLTHVSAHAVMRFTREPNDGPLGPYTIAGQPAWPVYDAPRASDHGAVLDVLAGKRGARRGIPLEESDLREVRDVYRAALDVGQPPTITVAQTMHVSRATASRWIAQAREQGYLGAAVPGRAGEHTKNRGK